MFEFCKKCEGYGLVKSNIDICSCKRGCIKCENIDKTGYAECHTCWGSGKIRVDSDCSLKPSEILIESTF